MIDSTGAEDRYVPRVIKERWPQAQRTKVRPAEWERLSDEDRRPEEDSALERLLGGIRASEVRVRYEDLERERERTRLLAEQRNKLDAQGKRLRRQRSVLMVALVSALAAAAAAISQIERSEVQ